MNEPMATSNRPTASTNRFLIGGFCGIVEISLTYPLEFIKNSLQVQPGRFKSPLDCARTNIAAHGVSVLYRGLPSWWVFAFPRNAVRFTCFDVLTHQLNVKHDLTRDSIAGIGAGVAEAFVALVPCQNLSIRMTHDANLPKQLQQYTNRFFPDACTIVRTIGFRGLFQGATPTVLKNSVNMSIRFPGFHYLKLQRLEMNHRNGSMDKDTNEPLHAIELMVCGGIAGAISSVVTHPIDVVKANMMGLNSTNYGSPLQATKMIFGSSGWKGFYVGLTPRITRVVMEVGLLFTIFETITTMLDDICAK